MVIRLIKKVINNVARGKIKVQKVELRKKLNTQRAIAKREAQVKIFVENGEKATAFVKAHGVEKLSLAKLKLIEKDMVLEISNFDKSCAVRLGGHFGKVHDTLIMVKARIKELEKLKKHN